MHPLARVWNETLVWPLTAELDCIGCYHTHLESSAPFCMRRDEACSHGPHEIDHLLQAMRQGEPYAWPAQRRRFEALQSKWFAFLRHHPSPPERMLRPAVSGNELVTSLVYRMLDQVAEMAGTRYHTSSMNEMTERLRELEARLFARDVELDEMRQTRMQQRPVKQPSLPTVRPPTRIVQLVDLTLRPYRCRADVAGPWLDVTAVDKDPQIRLPDVIGLGGRIQVRLTATSDHADTLQVFWSHGSAEFTEEQQRSATLSSRPASLELTLDLVEGEFLNLRIDPMLGLGRGRLRGSISGAFDLAKTTHDEEAHASRDSATKVPRPAVRNKRDPELPTPSSSGNGDGKRGRSGMVIRSLTAAKDGR